MNFSCIFGSQPLSFVRKNACILKRRCVRASIILINFNNIDQDRCIH